MVTIPQALLLRVQTDTNMLGTSLAQWLSTACVFPMTASVSADYTPQERFHTAAKSTIFAEANTGNRYISVWYVHLKTHVKRIHGQKSRTERAYIWVENFYLKEWDLHYRILYIKM